ncbi:uncharacterized protein LOC143244356 isoform X2 [Tachypleus tridentatus]|uniref:uncharacterized protein LOC143244356 isoform X2 n=1 Tax=Tachypleus tridentatus TaxID=6853 RepID=UPI003FD0BE43
MHKQEVVLKKRRQLEAVCKDINKQVLFWKEQDHCSTDVETNEEVPDVVEKPCLLQNQEDLEEIKLVCQLIEKAKLVRQKGKPKVEQVPKCKVTHSRQVRSHEEAVRNDTSQYFSTQRKDVVKSSGEYRTVIQDRSNPTHLVFRSSEHQKRMDGKMKQKSSSLSSTCSSEVGVISKTELLQLQRIAKFKPGEASSQKAGLVEEERPVNYLDSATEEASTSQHSVVDALSVLQVPQNFQQAMERNRRACKQFQKVVKTLENPQNVFLKKLSNALLEEFSAANKDKEGFSNSEDTCSDNPKLFSTTEQQRKVSFYQQTPIWLWNPHLDFCGVEAMPAVLTYVSQRELQELYSLLWEIQWTQMMLELHKTLKDEAIPILEKMDINDPKFCSVFCHLYSLLGHCGEKFPALLSAQQQNT